MERGWHTVHSWLPSALQAAATHIPALLLWQAEPLFYYGRRSRFPICSSTALLIWQAEQREMDVAETVELQQFLADVRSRKAADPDNWQEAFNISTEAPAFGSTAANASSEAEASEGEDREGGEGGER